MKRILLLALLALTSTAGAATQGTLKITIIRTEIVLVNNDYRWVNTVLCQEDLPITVIDGRTNGGGIPFERSDSCKFVEGGVNYTAHTYYLAAILYQTLPGFPARDTLGFSTQVTVVDNDKFETPPFATPAVQSFYTTDLNLKSAIMTLISEQSVSCPGDSAPITFTSATPAQKGCTVHNPLGIHAVFEYELN